MTPKFLPDSCVTEEYVENQMNELAQGMNDVAKDIGERVGTLETEMSTHTHSYNDLTDIPTNSVSWDDIEDRPIYENSYEDVVYLDEGKTTSGQLTLSSDLSLTVGATYKIEIKGNSIMATAPMSYSTTATAVTSSTFSNFSASGWSSYIMFDIPHITFPFNSIYMSLTNCTVRIAEVVTEIKPLDEKFLPESVEGVVIRSSTVGSTKKFKLSVDDGGTITATEV